MEFSKFVKIRLRLGRRCARIKHVKSLLSRSQISSNHNQSSLESSLINVPIIILTSIIILLLINDWVSFHVPSFQSLEHRQGNRCKSKAFLVIIIAPYLVHRNLSVGYYKQHKTFKSTADNLTPYSTCLLFNLSFISNNSGGFSFINDSQFFNHCVTRTPIGNTESEIRLAVQTGTFFNSNHEFPHFLQGNFK